LKSYTIDPTNGLAGALFILVGIFFGVQALNLELGTAFRMGPGYFPLVLSGLLILLGGIILISAFRTRSEPMGGFPLRGMLLILAAPVLFGILVRGLGFVPAIFVTAFVASFASRRMTVPMAAIIAVCLAAFATAVFIYGLELPFRPVGPWLGAN
jgi:hypothetical protein